MFWKEKWSAVYSGGGALLNIRRQLVSAAALFLSALAVGPATLQTKTDRQSRSRERISIHTTNADRTCEGDGDADRHP
jgi:hypothetical protein